MTWSASTAMASDVPYRDDRAIGFVALCDANGKGIEGGRLDAAPFVTRAIASTAAEAPYDGEGRTATLFAYQPRNGLEPSEWSGQQLTSSTKYEHPAHPTAQATPVDDSLAAFLDVYPAGWDGLVQLRLVLSVPGEPALTIAYAATDLRVDVDAGTWEVVNGGSVDCDAGGEAVSLIEQVGLPTSTTVAVDSESGDAASGDNSASGASRPIATSRGDNVAAKVGAVLAAALLLGVGAGFAVRRHGKSPLI